MCAQTETRDEKYVCSDITESSDTKCSRKRNRSRDRKAGIRLYRIENICNIPFPLKNPPCAPKSDAFSVAANVRGKEQGETWHAQDAFINSSRFYNPRIANPVFVFEDERKPYGIQCVGNAVS